MKNISRRVIYEFLLLATAICGIGYLIGNGIISQLNGALDESILRHIGTVSYSIENTIRKEIDNMHACTEMIEGGKADIKNFNDFANIFGKSVHISGIVCNDGTTVAAHGAPFPANKFDMLSEGFHRKDVVAYDKEIGLVLATPIYIEGKNCVSYQVYSNESLPEFFGVISYDGEGRINLATMKGDWVELTKSNNDALYNDLFTAPGFTDFFAERISKQLANVNRVVAHYDHCNEDYLCFGARIYSGEMLLFGIVKTDSVSAGAEYIHMALLGGLIAMLVILVMAARASMKSAENRALKLETENALQASKTKSEFLSNMSHEIRTPINAVIGMNEMILRESRDTSILEYAENVRIASNNLLGIVNDILDFSKIEAGKMEIIPVEYELSSMMNDLVNMIQKRAEKKGLQLVVNVDKNLPTILLGDEIRIKQVVTNILTNAVKYTEEGSVTLFVESTKRTPDTITLKFSVRDTGIGIKPEDIKKLFSAFERIEEERNRTIEGTGLGMNITQRLLNLMGTSLQVESIYGTGSYFWFEIEQKIIKNDPIGDFTEAFRRSIKQHNEYHEKFTAPKARILVVDDTAMNLTVVKGLLKQTKIRIDTAESGFECLKMVTRNKYDIIFLDHRMPKMDGIETLQEMKKLSNNMNKNTPVISLTANAISGAREEYINAGFQDYLTKPINSVKLEELIMNYLPPEKISSASAHDEKAPAVVEETPKIDALPDWLNNVKGLNVKEGIEHCGDVESYMEALKVFANSIVVAADEIGYYFNEGDWKNYTTKVHALKSSARVIGAMELSERAKRLEDAGNSGYFNEIHNDTEQLLKLYISYTEKLAPLIDDVEEDDSNKPPIAEDELAEAFETMKEAAANFDSDTIEFVLQSLEDYKLPSDERERVQNIKDAVSKFDWEKINQFLK